jgi:hypothetical protein
MTKHTDAQQTETTPATDPEADTQGFMKPAYDDGSGNKGRPSLGDQDQPFGLIPYRTNGPTVSNGYIYPDGTVHPYP